MNQRRRSAFYVSIVCLGIVLALVGIAAVVRFRPAAHVARGLLSAQAQTTPLVVRVSDESTPQAVMLAVRYAEEVRAAKLPLQADRFKCGCVGTFHWPPATGSWLRVPLALDAKGDQYVQMHYPDNVREMIVPQVRVNDLPIVNAGELK